ncbi:MAG: response regulator transcription factor [Planctomycetes bacterium]|nr:response regulator transcription factor [Planctomycetota bacterium]MBL7042737.1 response regulator transcription factor [Pirellulaceae bacterium]
MKILLVDDHQIVCDGLRMCLDADSRHEVVGEAADGRSAIQMAGELEPDVIIMDVGMPKMNGIEAARQILQDRPGKVKIICLSMHADREFIAEAFRAGVAGYLLKSSAFEELDQALDQIAAGRKYISPAISDIVIQDYVQQGSGAEPSPFSTLTSRERQILQMLAEGHTAKAIGSVLGISHKTVHAFRGQIMTKLDITSLPELTKYAIRHGLTVVE